MLIGDTHPAGPWEWYSPWFPRERAEHADEDSAPIREDQTWRSNRKVAPIPRETDQAPRRIHRTQHR